jgi:hypothetical protein
MGFKDYLNNKTDIHEGVGYELYAKGVDRVSNHCKQIDIHAKTLAKQVRDYSTLDKQKLTLSKLIKWVGMLNLEMKSIKEDLTSVEGYE